MLYLRPEMPLLPGALGSRFAMRSDHNKLRSCTLTAEVDYQGNNQYFAPAQFQLTSQIKGNLKDWGSNAHQALSIGCQSHTVQHLLLSDCCSELSQEGTAC